jgi:GH24 family phage-related lysozyme (muramidase)
VKAGETVKQGDKLGTTGTLVGISVIPGQQIYMLHFEHYSSSSGLNIIKPLTDQAQMPFKRREDLLDPIAILREGYENLFEAQTATDRIDIVSLKTSPKGIDFIKSYESYKEFAYNDSEGYCTIGFGHLIARDKCENIVIPSEFRNGITREKANQLFKTELARFEGIIKNNVSVRLHQYEFDALVSLIFNIGSFTKCPNLKANLNKSYMMPPQSNF